MIYPLTKSIIDESACVYRDQPIRKVVNGSNPEKDNELWNQDMKSMNYQSKMTELEKLVDLVGSPLITCHWCGEGEANRPVAAIEENRSLYMPDVFIRNTDYTNVTPGYPDIDLVSPDSYDVKIKDGEIMALTYPVTPGNFTGFNSKGEVDKRQKAVVIYWDNYSHARYTNAVKEDMGSFEESNPYGVIPAVAVHRTPPHRYFFQPVDEPLIYTNMACNVLSTIGCFIGRYQAHSFPILEGAFSHAPMQASLAGQIPVDGLGTASDFSLPQKLIEDLQSTDIEIRQRKEGAIDIAPDKPIQTPPGVKFSFETPSPNLDKLEKWMEHLIRTAAATHSLDPEQFIQSFTGNQSGAYVFSRKIRSIEAGKKKKPIFIEAERRLFQVIKAIRNTHAPMGERYSDDCELEITFKDTSYIDLMAPQERLEYLLSQQKAGLLSVIDVIMEMNPHLSEEEAIERFERVQEYRDKYQVVYAVNPVVEQMEQDNMSETSGDSNQPDKTDNKEDDEDE